MHKFISGTDRQFEDLERRARGVAFVAFHDQPMPPGVSPPYARVGFQVCEDETVAVYVDKDVSCPTDAALPSSVATWIRQGEIHFEDFAGCVRWIRGPLASSYDRSRGNSEDDAGEPEAVDGQAVGDVGQRIHPSLSPTSLTDLEAINQSLHESEDERVLLDNESLFNALSEHVRGQDAALKRVANTLRRHFGRVAPKRPCSLFAVGPTGVGKTHTAEMLSEVLMEQEVSVGFERFDMAEFQERHRVSTLLGAPPGYVGHGEGGQLVDALEREPRSIIVFDEIEKAHPNLLLALMNAMDAGRLSRAGGSSGANGRTVDCRRAIFFFTSNLKSDAIMAETQDLDPSRYGDVDDVCRKHLRKAEIKPEIIGRITSFLVYRPLSNEARTEIATLSIVRAAQEYGVEVVHIAPTAVVQLLMEQKKTGYGARSLEHCADRLYGDILITAAESYGTEACVRIDGDEDGGFSCVKI
jgi:hypothetical protein